MYEGVITKPVYQVLSELTQETKVEVALPLAIKDWVRLRLKEAMQERDGFERRYGMDFVTFQQAWQEGRIPNAHSHQVERDYWEWEATITDEQQLQRMRQILLDAGRVRAAGLLSRAGLTYLRRSGCQTSDRNLDQPARRYLDRRLRGCLS